MDYNDAPYIQAVSSFAVPGLFSNFPSAATLLRMARCELRVDLIENGDAVVTSFYKLLDEIEVHMKMKQKKDKPPSNTMNMNMNKKFIIEVEGLDGSGKTTLVAKLTEALSNNNNDNNSNTTAIAIATKTPSSSLKEIRPLWDHRGGILARAFYMVSNYVLAYEIDTAAEYNAMNGNHVIVVDRWYASTCAYTIARPPALHDHDGDDVGVGCTLSTDDTIANLPEEVYDWPHDLQLKPHVLLVLQIDPEVRQKRVDHRASPSGSGEGASRFNPWDDRLANEPQLGSRILEVLGSIKGPNAIHSLNANASVKEVVKQALDIVQPALQKHFYPQEYFASNPLEWWVYMSQQLHLCDRLGKRAHHALWNLQVAYNNNNTDDAAEGPPILKTVGLDRIDSNCIYYWTADSAFPSSSSSSSDPTIATWASILWMGGEYPTESQWRAEGVLIRVTPEECALRGFAAPPSLIAHVTAGCECEGDKDYYQRTSRPDMYDDLVQNARQQQPNFSNVCMIRFVPIRIEVLRGGPSTRLPGYPQRWEWTPRRDASSGDWSIRSILPFSRSVPPSLLQTTTASLRNMTIAIVGTHGAGKFSIGSALAKLLGFHFDPELGEMLRDQDSLVAGGHMHGDGSSTTTSLGEQHDWDDRILEAECQRDEQSACSRVVETWHCGNAAWCQLRQKQKNDITSADVDLERYKHVIAKHQEASLVLIVQLTLGSSSVMVKRRERYATMKERLPMQNEAKECEELYQALQEDNGEFISGVASTLGIPILQIDNEKDGEEAMNEVLSEILVFVQSNYYKRVVVSS